MHNKCSGYATHCASWGTLLYHICHPNFFVSIVSTSKMNHDIFVSVAAHCMLYYMLVAMHHIYFCASLMLSAECAEISRKRMNACIRTYVCSIYARVRNELHVRCMWRVSPVYTYDCTYVRWSHMPLWQERRASFKD